MPSNFRIPQARLDGAYGALMTRVAKRMWGKVPDNAYVLWHHKPVMKAVFGFEQKVAKWDALDPHRAIREMVRVLAPGGVITGSSLFTDTGLRYEPVRRIGARAGVLGPMCSSDEARDWLVVAGCDRVDLTLHGGLGYFRASKDTKEDT